MKNFIILILFIGTLNTFGQQTATISEGTQKITWIGKAAVGGYAPEGTLDIKSGLLTFIEQRMGSLEIVFDMKSLQQENKQLEGHLREKDFFHVKRYPTAVFKLNAPLEVTSEDIVISGSMTIKKETHTEDISAKISKKDGKIYIRFEHVMDRTLYGITYNSPSIFKKLKENAIADKFQIKGELVFAIQELP